MSLATKKLVQEMKVTKEEKRRNELDERVVVAQEKRAEADMKNADTNAVALELIKEMVEMMRPFIAMAMSQIPNDKKN